MSKSVEYHFGSTWNSNLIRQLNINNKKEEEEESLRWWVGLKVWKHEIGPQFGLDSGLPGLQVKREFRPKGYSAQNFWIFCNPTLSKWLIRYLPLYIRDEKPVCLLFWPSFSIHWKTKHFGLLSPNLNWLFFMSPMCCWFHVFRHWSGGYTSPLSAPTLLF